jgi:hypothetical protein
MLHRDSSAGKGYARLLRGVSTGNASPAPVRRCTVAAAPGQGPDRTARPTRTGRPDTPADLIPHLEFRVLSHQ